LDVNMKKRPSAKDVNETFAAAAAGKLKGIIDYSTAPLVSSDFNGVAASCSFDSTQTASVDDGALIRVCGWYDNEWGFSMRMCDTAALFGGM
ncbi:MAG TPA: erythrose-4-phosphate dehydrogenase, partial [Acetobacteraceae bacterium]|nr:erythrose-4-phosphate dehydrogenase [Acetobacteraceae bacterium]